MKDYNKEHKSNRTRRRIVTFLAMIVMLITVYVLMLPAITMEWDDIIDEDAWMYVDDDEEDEYDDATSSDADKIATISDAEYLATISNAAAIATFSNALAMPLNITDYTENAWLEYKTENEDWKSVEGAEKVPGNASFRLKVEFDKVKVTDLNNAGRKMVYEMPEIFRDVSANSDITSDDKQKAGTITASNRVVTLTFDESWLALVGTSEISGEFYVEAKADLSKIPGDGMGEIKIGDVTITINFDDNLILKYGEVELQKELISLTEETDGDYLNYCLTIRTGEDGCPDVSVTDKFTKNEEYIDSYVLESIEPEGEQLKVSVVSVDKNENLIWAVGDMEPNETRTLSYKVKLKDTYTGVTAKGPITNLAEAKAGEYERDEASAVFTPKAGGTMSKIAAEFIENEEKTGGTIAYTIWVKALDDNTYTLDNVYIQDSLDGSVVGGNITLEALRAYLAFDPDSFELYEGGHDKQNGHDGLTLCPTEEKPVFPTDDSGNAIYNSNFKFNVGDLKPGECRTLVYKVKVDQGIYTAAGNEKIRIANRAGIFTDENRTDGGNSRLNAYNTEKWLSSKRWSRKLAGDAEPETKEIEMSGAAEPSFTVPGGSYRYEVVVNEAGNWNMQSTTLKDTLSTYMKYVGYLRVDAYKIENGTDYPSDDSAVSGLHQKTPVKTVWVKVDGQQSFSFEPKELGLEGTYAYLLTYYAKPANLGDVGMVAASNEFLLDGSVIGNGDFQYTLTGIKVNVDVQLEGSNSFSAKKSFWYYDPGKGTNQNGLLYWMIQIDGNTIPKDTKIKDVCSYHENHNPHQFFRIEGGYIAKTNSFPSGDTIEDIGGIPLSETDYRVDGNEITLLQSITLGSAESLYFVVSTQPTRIPDKWDYKTYANELQTANSANDAWISQSKVDHILYGGEKIYKALGSVFEAKKNSDGTITSDSIEILQNSNQENRNPVLQYDHLTASGEGIYAAWYIRINQDAVLNGSYQIEEQLPEGLEVVYIQRYSTGQGYSEKPVFSEIEGLDGWTRVDKKFVELYDKNPTPAIYYVNGQKIRWEVSGLKAEQNAPGKYYAEFLIVCKITDNMIHLGQEQEFVNRVSLYNQSGDQIGSDTNSVVIKRTGLHKAGVYDPEVNNGRYPFEITLNEFGEDLVPNGTTIDLIDELGSTLELDTDSILITRTDTKENITDWKASLADGEDGTSILTLTIPDNVPLTIQYDAIIVNAAPGDSIDISNKAHWKGYSPDDGSSVIVSKFEYKVAASVGAASPSIKIVKRDQYDTQNLLAGAEFELVEGTFNGSFAETEDGLHLTGETGDDGILYFGKDSEHKLSYNTVYRLRETKAPPGYVLDTDPHYFVIAKKENNSYPSFDEKVKVYYLSAEYTYQAYNHRGEIAVKKQFADAAGTLIKGSINGTYTFGIFDSKDAEQAIQKESIVYGNGTVNPINGMIRFTNLELGKTYYVYELDDEGNPMKHGTAGMISRNPFVVSYQTEGVGIELTEADNAKEEVVTNRMNFAELPKTGGTGTSLYTIGGLLLILAAGFGLCNRSKRKY